MDRVFIRVCPIKGCGHMELLNRFQGYRGTAGAQCPGHLAPLETVPFVLPPTSDELRAKAEALAAERSV